VTIWTVADLRDLPARRGYDVRVATVYRHFVSRPLARRGDRYRRPRHDLTHRQDADAVASATQVPSMCWPNAKKGGSCRGWIPPCRRGHLLTVPAAGQDQRRAVFGAVDSAAGRVVWHLAAHKGGAAFAAFLARLGTIWPDEHLVLVMDTVSDHRVSDHRAPAVRAWWAEQDGRITPLWLPGSTPNLTLMERVRRLLKQTLACHRFWADVAGLEAAAATLLDRLEAHVHAATPPAFRLRQDFCEPA
jgi:DDE superfamily endonuclease